MDLACEFGRRCLLYLLCTIYSLLTRLVTVRRRLGEDQPYSERPTDRPARSRRATFVGKGGAWKAGTRKIFLGLYAMRVRRSPPLEPLQGKVQA